MTSCLGANKGLVLALQCEQNRTTWNHVEEIPTFIQVEVPEAHESGFLLETVEDFNLNVKIKYRNKRLGRAWLADHPRLLGSTPGKICSWWKMHRRQRRGIFQSWLHNLQLSGVSWLRDFSSIRCSLPLPHLDISNPIPSTYSTTVLHLSMMCY